MTQSISIIPGSTIDDRFTLVRPLGRGSMGSVWLARHLALDIDVAIKFIDSSLTKEPNYVERFQREARAAAQLKSPHVVQVLDYGTDQAGRAFMAMEYLEGKTLGRLLEERFRLDFESTARVVAHAARGLGKAHAVGIVHRDIKPENLFVCGERDEEGFVLKVLDFGVARAGYASTGGTLAGQLVGSPLFMSPEQARGYRTIDHRADLFSLAVVAYQCLTGTFPFNGDGLGEVLVSICTTQPIPPSQLIDEIPPTVDAWFERALAKKPHMRFESARELSISLAEALGVTAASGVDFAASYSRASLSQSSSGSATITMQQSDSEKTQITNPKAPRLSTHGTAIAASRIQPTSISEAIAPLTSVPHTLGVALLDHNDDCLIIRGSTKDPALYTSVAQHARTVAETVESIDGATGPTHLSARFDSATVYVRWVGPFSLIALGDAQMRPLLLTVGSNRLADRLLSFTEQLGGVEPVANLLRDSGIGIPLTALKKKTQSSAEIEPEEEPPETNRGGKVRTDPPAKAEEFKLPIRSFFGFGSSKKDAPAEPPAPTRTTQQMSAPRPAPGGPPPAPSTQAKGLSDSQARPQRVQVHRGQVVGRPKETPEAAPKKKVRVYRGRVIDEK